MRTSRVVLKSVQIQDRDLALLRGLFESRIMTLAHIAAIYFDGRAEYTKKRILKLKRTGLIGERPRRTNEPAILFLAKAGLFILRDHGILSLYPSFPIPALIRRANVSERTINHELAVMDVKAAFHAATQRSSTLTLLEFGTWPRLYEFEAQHPTTGTMTVKPDGFLRIRERAKDGTTKDHVFFLEVDRSTEVLDIITSRAFSYLDYYRSGGFALKCGASRDEYRRHPFRVLIVCKSAERRDNIAERLLHCTQTILTQVSLSTISEVVSSPLGEIWRRPVVYRQAGDASGLSSSSLI